MEEVSVDTNIWISLARLGVVQEAFRLPYRYLMEETAAKDELLSPRDLLLRVCALGLVTTTLSEEELFYVLSLQGKQGYARLSTYDFYALAIAKCRGLMLLTGDGALRKIAKIEGVGHHGLLWVIVECTKAGIILKERKEALFEEIEKNPAQYRIKAEDVHRARNM